MRVGDVGARGLWVWVLLVAVSLWGVMGCRNATDGEAPPGAQVITVEAAPSGGGGGIASVSASAQPLVLRTYSLPEAQAQRAASVLRGVLEGWPEGQGQVGRVSQAPGGQVVVLAPEAMHGGIEQLVAELASAKGEPVTAPPTLQMSYWLVAATPGGGGGLDASLSPIAPTLQALGEQLGGAVSFELLEQLTLVSDEGEHATVGGREALIEQSVWRRDGNTQAEIQIGLMRGPRLTTRVRVRDGQTLVLGQAGLDPRVTTAAVAAPPADPQGAPQPTIQTTRRAGTLFYVVQARVLDDAAAP